MAQDSQQGGFTIVELLVTIVVLAIVAGGITMLFLTSMAGRRRRF